MRADPQPAIAHTRSQPAGRAAGARPLRVLLWSPYGSGEHYHGPGSFAFRLYSSAAPGRFEVSLAHGWETQLAYPLFKAQYDLGRLPGTLFSKAAYMRRARRFLAEHHSEFDIVHGLGGFHLTVSPAFRAQTRHGLPAVIFLTNHRLELSDKSGWKAFLGLPAKRRAMIKQLSGVIAMSQAIYDELREYDVPDAKIARIPMGVNTERFRPAANDAERRALRSQFGWRDLPTIVFVGGITERKRPHLLIETIGVLKERGHECQVAFVGPEHEAEYVAGMKQHAKELKVAEQVIWFGFTQDIAPLYRSADFFALPSSNEGMPAALVEAMASGLPALMTPVSGSGDLIEDGRNGRIIEPNAGEMADAVSSYLSDRTLAHTHGQAARQKVLARFSTHVVLDAYERLFRRILAGGTAAE